MSSVQHGYYEHYKGGIYEVLTIATDSETLEKRVIYRDTKGDVWDRPLQMWSEQVDGKPRFRHLPEAEGRRRFVMAYAFRRAKSKNDKE